MAVPASIARKVLAGELPPEAMRSYVERPRVCPRGQLSLWHHSTPWPRVLVRSEVALARAVAPACLATTLESLVQGEVLAAYEIADGLVYLEGDHVALQLAVARMDEEERGILGDDVERGFQESSGIYGEVTRGGTTARAADFHAVSFYYAEAGAFLERDRTMSKRTRRIWELHCKGESERTISAKVGISVRQVREQLETTRQKAGLSRRKA